MSAALTTVQTIRDAIRAGSAQISTLSGARCVLTSIPDACVKLISSPLIAVSTAEDEAAALGWTPPEF